MEHECESTDRALCVLRCPYQKPASMLALINKEGYIIHVKLYYNAQLRPKLDL